MGVKMFYAPKYNLGHNKIGLSVRSCVRASARSFVRPFNYFFKGMPVNLYIYPGAFVTYCDPILVLYDKPPRLGRRVRFKSVLSLVSPQINLRYKSSLALKRQGRTSYENYLADLDGSVMKLLLGTRMHWVSHSLRIRLLIHGGFMVPIIICGRFNLRYLVTLWICK